MWAENSHQALGDPNPFKPQGGAIWSPDNSTPVLACRAFIESQGDFRNQAELDREWSSLIQILMTTTLTEQEVLAVLSSGILQTPTGRAIAGLFEGAILRSVRPLGALPIGRLEQIIDVICHLPPGQWQAALGENLRFASGQNAEGVTRFIQSELDRSSALRDERIANKEQISDAEWETLKELTKKGRQYIRSSDGKVDSSLLMLEDAHDLRPSSKDMYAQLNLFISRLEKGDVKRVRWTDRYVAEVKALRDQVKPFDEVIPGWLERIVGLSWLENLFDPPGLSSAPINSSTSAVRVRSSINDSRWLLSALQRIERNADFYLNVNKSGPLIPDSFVGKIFYVCNLLNAIGCLRLNSSHISTARPLYTPVNLGAEDGGDEGPESPSDNAILPMGRLDRFASLVDGVLTLLVNGLTPWDSAYAEERGTVVVVLSDLNEQVYRATTEANISSMNILKEQLADWLNRMSENLLSSGVAVLSRMGDLVERNPRSAVAAFAVYMAVSNLYAHWFLPEGSKLDLPSEPDSDLFFAPDPATDIRENILDELAFMLEDLPNLASTLERRIEQSNFTDPHLDVQLLQDIEVLLQQPALGTPDVTYLERVEEIIQLAQCDELDDYPPADSLPVLASESQSLSRHPRNVALQLASASAQSAHWVLEALRGQKVAAIPLEGRQEEVAPGTTFDVATDKILEAFKAAEAIVDPQAFIEISVNTIISESSLLESLKKTLNPASTIEVAFKEITLRDKFNNAPRRRERIQVFTLAELATDYHLRNKASNEEFTIRWPANCTESFKNTILNADLQAAYKDNIRSTLERADVKELWVMSKEYELKVALEFYKCSVGASPAGLRLADSFLQGKSKSHVIYLNNPRENTPVKVSNAIYVGDDLDGLGLFIFLGGNNTVIELPAGPRQKQHVIENNKSLQEQLLQRIPLFEKMSRESNDFKFKKPVFEIFKVYPAYAPVLFDVTLDAVGELYKRQLAQVLSDMDTLVSTDEERFTDGLVAAIGNFLTALSIYAMVPRATVLASKGARMAASFLFGASASSTELIRGAMSDDPKIAADFRSNAFRGFIMEFAGPLAGRLIGKAISKSVATRLARFVFNRIRSMIRTFPKSIKWIPPRVTDAMALFAKLEFKFKNHRIVNYLGRLDEGPKVAQKIMKETNVIYFSGPKEGYVYQGFVMRGDMRPPHVVFEKGFKLRTPVTDVNQVNGMRGSFGGGKDALDMDGQGISTSPFYKQSGAGAYQYGGGRGGYTYVVDARAMRGYHLYGNDHWKKYPNSKVGMRPYEVNYGQDIPASAVIGCYDKQGNFIPNPLALQNSIDSSNPFQLPDGVFYRPAKSFIQSTNTTSEAAGHPWGESSY